MGWPKRNSRKGHAARFGAMAHESLRDWLPYRGDWQPSLALRVRTLRQIADLRAELDAWEKSL